MAPKKDPAKGKIAASVLRGDDDEETAARLWPVWDEKDLEAEKWAEPGKKEKDKPQLFEDDRLVELPAELQGTVAGWKRLSELFPDSSVVSPSRFVKAPQVLPVTAAEQSFLRMKRLSIEHHMAFPTISLVTNSQHLLGSETMRVLITYLTQLQARVTPTDPQVHGPWESIYPRGKDGPAINPAGKYAVKLFWLGQWRKVIVDDRVPVDSTGRVLLPLSSIPGELWPALVAKAVLKLGRHFLTRLSVPADAPRGSTLTVPPTPALPAASPSAPLDDGAGRPGSSLPSIAGSPARAAGPATSTGSVASPASAVGAGAAGSLPLSPAGPLVSTAQGDVAAGPTLSKTGSNGNGNTALATALMHMLTGWLPETTPTAAPATVLPLLSALCQVPKHELEAESSSLPSSARPVPAPAIVIAPTPTASTPAGSATGRTPAPPGTSRDSTSKDKGGRRLPMPAAAEQRAETPRPSADAAPAPAAAAAAGHSSSTQPQSASSHGAGPASSEATSDVSAVYVVAWLSAADGSDVGLKPAESHPVRVLSCHHIPSLLRSAAPQYTSLDDWVLELQSPLALFTGRLGFGDTQSWRPLHQMALGVSRDHETLQQTVSRDACTAGVPALPYRFRMFATEFFKYFSSVTVFRKGASFPFSTSLIGCRESPLTFAPSEAGEARLSDTYVIESPGVDLNTGRPWLLHVYTPTPLTILVAFSVAPLRDDTALGEDGEPKPANLELEHFDWKSCAAGEVALRLQTPHHACAPCLLPPGRSIVRVTVDASGPYSITLFSPKELQVGPESRILKLLSGVSPPFTQHATAVVAAVTAFATRSSADAILHVHAIAKAHASIGALPRPVLVAFFKALHFAMSTVLSAEWNSPLPNEATSATETTLGQAWTAILAELQRLCLRLFVQPSRVPALLPPVPIARARITRTAAAITLQRYLRGALARRCVTLMRGQLLNRFREGVAASCTALDAAAIPLASTLFARLKETNKSLFDAFSFAKAEEQRCHVRDLAIKVEEKAAGDWFIAFQHTINVTVPTPVSLRALLSEPACSQITLRIINNDTRAELPSLLGTPLPQVLQPTLSGYTLLCHGRAIGNQPATTLGLRVVSYPDLFADSPAAVSLTGPPTCQEISQACTRRKENMMFLYEVTGTTAAPIAIDLTLHNMEDVAGVSVSLAVLIDGKPVASASGLHAAVPCLMVSPGTTLTLVGKLFGDVPLSDAGSAAPRGPSGKTGRRTTAPSIVASGAGAASTVPPSKKGSLAGTPLWRLRVYCKDSLTLNAEPFRDDEIAASKAAWESFQPGRRERGTTLRQKYLQTELPPGPASSTVIPSAAIPSFAPLPLSPRRVAAPLSSSGTEDRPADAATPGPAALAAPTIVLTEAMRQARAAALETNLQSFAHAREQQLERRRLLRTASLASVLVPQTYGRDLQTGRARAHQEFVASRKACREQMLPSSTATPALPTPSPSK